MRILEKNLKALCNNKIYSYASELTKEYITENIEFKCDYINELIARDGNKIITIDTGVKTIRLNSKYKPLMEAEKWLEQYELDKDNICVVLFGMANTIILNRLLEKISSNSKVYIYEPDKMIYLYNLYNTDMTMLFADKRIKIVNDSIFDITQDDFVKEILSDNLLENIVVMFHPGYTEAFKDEAVAMNNIISNKVNGILINQYNVSRLSKIMVINTIRNLHFIADSNLVSEFINKRYKNIPAIIVSAGPSLDKNIKFLMNAVGKAFIFSTDTALKYLAKNNIPCDAVICMDPEKSIEHFCNDDYKSIPMFCALESRNEIMEFNTGKKIFVQGQIFMKELYKKFNICLEEYDVGGSVATAAIATSVKLGFKNIILIGQDLAYGNGTTHAGGVKKTVEDEEKLQVLVDGIYGETVKSRADWNIYREWIENYIDKNKNINIIDATEGGAMIHGSIVMTLSEAIDKYCESDGVNIKKILQEKKATFKDRKSEIEDKIKHLEKQFEDIQKKVSLGQQYTEQLISATISNTINTTVRTKKLKEIDKINSFLEKQPAYEILDRYMTCEIKEQALIKDNSFLGALKTTKRFYKLIEQAVVELMPILQEVL